MAIENYYIPSMELEGLILTIYEEFHNTHKELFEKDRQLYWHEAFRYKDDKVREYRYYGKKPEISKPANVNTAADIVK